jgi:hypothetical protein
MRLLKLQLARPSVQYVTLVARDWHRIDAVELRILLRPLMDALKRSKTTAGLNQRRAGSCERLRPGKRKCCCPSAASALPRLKQRKTSLPRRGPGNEHDRRISQRDE